MPNQQSQIISPRQRDPIVFITVYISAFYIVWILKAFYLNPLLKSWLMPSHPILHSLASDGGKLLIWILPVLFIVQYYLNERPLSYLKLDKNIPAGMLWGSAVSAAYIGILLAVAYYQGKPLFNWNIPLSNWVGGILLVGIVEEIPYRGLLLPMLQDRRSFFKANLIVSVLFLLIHFPGWLAHHETLSFFLINGCGVFVKSLIFGWLVKHTNSLWAPIIFHMANNFGHMVILP